MRWSRCHCTARESTIRSRSRPFWMRLGSWSFCEMRATSWCWPAFRMLASYRCTRKLTMVTTMPLRSGQSMRRMAVLLIGVRWAVFLPDMNAVGGREVELVARFDVEGGIPRVQIADGAGAEQAGGVGIGEHPGAQSGFAVHAGVVLGEGDEELLVACAASDDGRRLAVERGVVTVQRGGDARNVCDVLSERLAAVDREVGERLVGVVLGGQRGGGCVEVGEVRWRPPIADAAPGVEGSALGVEGGGDLVPNDGSDRPIVRGGGRLGIEERRLQNRGRKVEAVVQREVDGVDGLGLHAPLFAVHGNADAAELVVILEEATAPDIAEEISGLDLEAGVAAPVVGVADTDVECAEFGERLGFGGRGHPRQGRETDAEGSHDVVYHRLGLGFGFGREVALHVQLADCVAEQTVYQGDAALIAGTHLESTGEGLAEHCEALVGERLRQIVGVGHDEVVREIVLPDVAGDGCYEGGFGGEGGELPGVVRLLDVLAVSEREMTIGDGALELEDGGGAGISVVEAGEFEHGRDMGLVSRPDGLHAVAGL